MAYCWLWALRTPVTSTVGAGCRLTPFCNWKDSSCSVSPSRPFSPTTIATSPFSGFHLAKGASFPAAATSNALVAGVRAPVKPVIVIVEFCGRNTFVFNTAVMKFAAAANGFDWSICAVSNLGTTYLICPLRPSEGLNSTSRASTADTSILGGPNSPIAHSPGTHSLNS
eukprot:2310777-Rhodomonas_salina.2